MSDFFLLFQVTVELLQYALTEEVPIDRDGMGIDRSSGALVQLPIRGSAFTVHVLGACPEKCTGYGNGIDTVVAGFPAQFQVQIRTEHGRAVWLADRGLALEVEVANVKKQAFVRSFVYELADKGLYDVQYQPTVAGQYSVVVTVDGAHIAGSPFAVRVVPGAADAHFCIAQGSVPPADRKSNFSCSSGSTTGIKAVMGDCFVWQGLSESLVSEEAFFFIEAIDHYGNRLECGGDNV